MIFWITTFHLTLWLDSNQIERSHVIHLGTMCKSSHTNKFKNKPKILFCNEIFVCGKKNVFLIESHWHYLFTHSWMIFIRCLLVRLLRIRKFFSSLRFHSFIHSFNFFDFEMQREKNKKTTKRNEEKFKLFSVMQFAHFIFFSFFFKSTFTTKWMFLWYFFEGTIELKYNVHSVSSKKKRKERNFQTIIIMLVVVKVWRWWWWWWSCLRI